jgi:hypothetical protein
MTPENVMIVDITPDAKTAAVRTVAADGSFSYTLVKLDGLKLAAGPGVAMPAFGPKEYLLSLNSDATAFYTVRILSTVRAEIWRTELPSNQRTLLHTITTPGIPALSNAMQVAISRDGKSYAYQYHPAQSTEYVIDGLR